MNIKKLLIILAILINHIVYANTYNLKAIDSEFLNITMTGKGYIKSEERSSDFNVTLTANVMNNSKEKATISVFLSAVFTIEGMKTFTEKTTMKLDNKGRVIVDGDGCILSNDPAPLPTVASVGYKSDKYIYTCKDGSINFSVSFLEKGQYDYVNFIEKTT